MPRQRIDHSRAVYVLPADFPERLKSLQKQSGLSWAEIARRIGTYPYTVWRWHEGGVSPITSIRWHCWNWPTTLASPIC